MARLELENVSKRFGSVPAVDGVDLKIEHGEFVVFVGPSGCGKSTLLRMISGLESVTAGRILIGGRDVTNVAPSRRGVAMVFQSYALFPHMTAAENIGFGLRLAKVAKDEIDRRVEEVAATLQIEPLLGRYPRELSGGQRQRVAIGRSIIRDPQVFLFDEPLSNLDAALRVRMRLEIARLRNRLDATMVYVTHDQTEAMTLADRIAVISRGELSAAHSAGEIDRERIGLLMALYWPRPKTSARPQIAFGLMLAGAAGNLIDRLAFGHVIDFIDVLPWFIFNVADIAILFGLIGFAWDIPDVTARLLTESRERS